MKQKTILNFLFLVIILNGCFILGRIVYSLDQVGESTQPVTLTPPIPKTTPEKLIGQIIKTVLGVVGSLALLMFVYGGLLWMTSMGSSEKVTKGKNVIIWSTLGLVIIFTAYAVISFVLNFLYTGGAG